MYPLFCLIDYFWVIEIACNWNQSWQRNGDMGRQRVRSIWEHAELELRVYPSGKYYYIAGHDGSKRIHEKLTATLVVPAGHQHGSGAFRRGCRTTGYRYRYRCAAS